MSVKKHLRRQHVKILYITLICLAQTSLTQFFSLYLKHLNLAAFEVGLTRACQVWLSVLLVPLWYFLDKHNRSACLKRTTFCVFLILVMNTHFYLIFTPSLNNLQDITHCQKNENLLSGKQKPNDHHNYALTNIRVPSSLHKKLNHRIPDVSSEDNVRSKAGMSFKGRNTSHSDYINGIKNVSNQSHVNNLEHNGVELPLFPERIHETNFHFSPIVDNNETALKSKLNNDSSTSIGDLVRKETQNNKKGFENAFSSNKGHKFPISFPRDVNLNINTQKTEYIEAGNHESRKDYFSGRNKANDMLYHLHHQEQMVHPWQNHHNVLENHNRNDNDNRILLHARKTEYLENNPQIVPSDRSQENNNKVSYGTFETNPGTVRLHNIKPSIKNENVNGQDKKEEKYSGDVYKEAKDWNILKTFLKKQRFKRSLRHKLHPKTKRHHHNNHARQRKFNQKSIEFYGNFDEKFDLCDQYPLSDNIFEVPLKEATKRNNRNIRSLMSMDESEEQNEKNSDSVVKKLHKALLNNDNISKKLVNIIINNKIHNILSLKFGTLVLVAVLAGVLSRAIIATSYRNLISDKVGGSAHQNIIGYQREDSQQIWTLFIWGIFGCPAIALLVLLTECSYQPRVFIMFSTALIGMALVVVLFFLQIPDSVWEWKLKESSEEIDHKTTSSFKRFGNGIATFVAAFAVACNSEFILWYMDTLNGFPYNYQLLYCGYIGIEAIFQAVVKFWLLRKQVSDSKKMQDFNNFDIDTSGGDGLKSIGLVLLGLHFLAASVLHPVWSLLFLAILQGCSKAFLVSEKTSRFWAAGYGLGCVTAGFMVNLYGANMLFWIMAGGVFVWSAMVTLSRGLLKCIGNNGRDRTSYSQLLFLGEDSDEEQTVFKMEDDDGEGEEEEVALNNDEDWLERAMKNDERRRIMSCPT